MEYVFYITYILYMFFKTLYITNNRKNIEVDVIYIFFYLIELFFKTEIYFIFSLVNIAFIIYYNKKQIRKFSIILYEVILFYILIVLFKPPIIILMFLSFLNRFLIIFFRRFNKRINELWIKNNINVDNLILIKTENKDAVKEFLDYRYDVLVIENNNNVYREFYRKYDKFTKIIISDNNILNIKNVIEFSNGHVNDIVIDFKKGDYLIKSISYKKNTIIKFCKNKDNYFLETKLYGIYDNKMALSLYVLGLLLNINNNDIRKYIYNLKGNKIIFDNNIINNTKCLSFLDHLEGIDLIKKYRKNKVIVTSGINESLNDNALFIDKIIHNFSYVILVDSENVSLIYEGLLEGGFNKNKIYLVEKIDDYKKIVSIIGFDKSYVLLDGDLNGEKRFKEN